jgi:hypothetical protein
MIKAFRSRRYAWSEGFSHECDECGPVWMLIVRVHRGGGIREDFRLLFGDHPSVPRDGELWANLLVAVFPGDA